MKRALLALLSASLLVLGVGTKAQTNPEYGHGSYSTQTTDDRTQDKTESARTLGNQDASTQSDSVRTINVVTTGSESQTISCPAPQTGTIAQTRTVTYTNGVATSYGSWVTTSKDCQSPPPITTTQTETQTLACPAPQTGTIAQTRTVTYVNGVATSATAWVTTSNTCTNSGGSTSTKAETQTLPCPAPQTGTITQTRTVTYTNGVQTSATAWVNTSNSCQTPPPVCNSVTQCEGANYVTRNSCTGDITNVDWGACKPPTPTCANGAPDRLYPTCTEYIGIICVGPYQQIWPEPWQIYTAENCGVGL